MDPGANKEAHLDRTMTDHVDKCKIYDIAQFAKKYARPSVKGLRKADCGDHLAQVIHFCPSYATGFAFYQAELSQFPDAVLTKIVTLLSSRAFDHDQRWELLQLVTQANFVTLAATHQRRILSLVERSPALAIHLLLASLNNRLRHRSSQRVRGGGVTDKAVVESMTVPTLIEGASRFEQSRYPAILFDDIRFTLHLLIDAHPDKAVADSYMQLVTQPGYMGPDGELGLFINRLIQQDLALTSSHVLRQLAQLVTDSTFCFLTLKRQCLLLGTLKNLAVLEWPDAIEHLSVLAHAFKRANRLELVALQRYFGQAGRRMVYG